MKQLAFIFSICILFTSACKPIDIRPSGTKAQFDSLPDAQGTLDNVINKAGGLVEWNNAGVVSFKITDEWITQKKGTPLKDKSNDLIIDWSTGDINKTKVNIEGTQNFIGVQDGRTYETEDAQTKENGKAVQATYVNHLRMMLELPFRLYTADIKKYLGTEKFEGQEYHKVFFAWETHKPDKELEQYIIYINYNNAQLEFVTHTIRALGKKEFVTVKLSVFNNYGRFKIPNKLEFFYNQYAPGETLNRKITVRHGATGLTRPQGYYTPLPKNN